MSLMHAHFWKISRNARTFGEFQGKQFQGTHETFVMNLGCPCLRFLDFCEMRSSAPDEFPIFFLRCHRSMHAHNDTTTTLHHPEEEFFRPDGVWHSEESLEFERKSRPIKARAQRSTTVDGRSSKRHHSQPRHYQSR